MGTVKKLAEEVHRGLEQAVPKLPKTVVRKLALAVGAMIEGQTPNTVELANLLPLETERQDMREQWLRRLLKPPRLRVAAVMEPLAREQLAKAARNGQTVLLSMDQTDLGDRMAVLMVSVRVGERALPLAWLAEAGPANIGFEGQKQVLEQVAAGLPRGVEVLLSADRFYPSAALFTWLQAQGWGYRRFALRDRHLYTVMFGDGLVAFEASDERDVAAAGAKIGSADLSGDLNCDGAVTLADQALVATYVGVNCLNPTEVRTRTWGVLKTIYR